MYRSVEPQCDEITIFDSVAERTGNTSPMRGFRGRPNLARSMTDLARRHRTLGDGIFYLAEGQWPTGANALDLKQPIWDSMTHAVEITQARRRE